MCLAIPMRVAEIKGDYATVELDGVSYPANVTLIKDIKIGDYVIIHAGFAIEKMNEKAADEIYELFRDMEKAAKS